MLSNQYKQTEREGYASKDQDSGNNKEDKHGSGWVERWWNFYTLTITENVSECCHQHL